MRIAILALAAMSAFSQTSPFSGAFTKSTQLAAGQTVEVYAGLPKPSELPANGRVAVTFGGMRKVLHAFDPDFFVVFRAPKAGAYTLAVTKVEDEEPIFNKPRWRETGTVEKVNRFPRATPWPAGKSVALRTWIKPVSLTRSGGVVVEAEPNDSIAAAQPIAIGASGADETIHITGGADDAEYFDNGDIGESGMDWFRIDYKGSEPRLFTANLGLPDPFVVAQLLFYTADGKEYREGANPNERVHQQNERHRTAMSRILKPGGTYYLKVEANSPGYEVELRLRRPAPYDDPRAAIRQAMYDHIGQVDAWLLNRPRGASVDRRIRDTGSLLGSHCMSCHTQSGVWGPAGPLKHGYRIENVINYRHLSNLAYESMRPTNTLVEAANNTSLAPLDLGDGPAGTRVAGFNITTLEALVTPRKLHSAQQIRAANFVLQSNDPTGINAAGPGSNIGQALVYRFASEILLRAWQSTRNPKYFDEIENKARKMLKVNPRFSDDLSNRILFFQEVFPRDYIAVRGESDETKAFVAQIAAQVRADEQRLRAIQRPDGMWQFDPGSRDGASWKLKTDDKDVDPAPTALAITALHSLGAGESDPAVSKAVRAMLSRQDPFGRWNQHALTGFVTTAYTLQALARMFPVNDPKPTRANFVAKPGESLDSAVARMRALAQTGLSPEDRQFTGIAIDGAVHASPLVRYWAQIALGALHDERGVQQQIAGLSDPVKMVREAARWGLRQTLLDDKGWDHLFPALATGEDLTREWAAGALVMRADGVMSHSGVVWPRLTSALRRLMIDDPHPAVRAWATRAAWNWWVWNPPVREDLNRAWVEMLEREETSSLAETAKRYQTEALFIANGQRANGSKEHQYPELTKLFDALSKRVDAQRGSDSTLIRRLVNVASTYYNQAGGDGGPGQMGYVTPKSGEALGKAIFSYWNGNAGSADDNLTRLSLEASANVLHDPLQKKLLEFSTNGPEKYRTLAATSLADPRVITLNAAQEFIEPLMEQVTRGAQETERRVELVNPILKLFTRARWNMPKSAEQRKIFYDLLLPVFAEERGKLAENTRELLQMDKDSADWYLARSMARVIHSNADLQTEELAARLPQQFATPMEQMVWLDAARWLLTWETAIPEVRAAAKADDQHAALRQRAAELVARQLTGNVDRRLRDGAAAIAASNVQVRHHPAVAGPMRKIRPALYEPDPAEARELNADWKRNYEYFRDWVTPELLRPNRDDELGCMGCHGVAGRVPSMEFKPADNSGFLSPRDTWANYRILLERVNEADVENSKLLRKPLNVQSGKEDGHQGGRRFNPEDRGYQIFRRWVLDAAALKSAQGAPRVTGGGQ